MEIMPKRALADPPLFDPEMPIKNKRSKNVK
jgi:hypothetical protein